MCVTWVLKYCCFPCYFLWNQLHFKLCILIFLYGEVEISLSFKFLLYFLTLIIPSQPSFGIKSAQTECILDETLRVCSPSRKSGELNIETIKDLVRSSKGAINVFQNIRDGTKENKIRTEYKTMTYQETGFEELFNYRGKNYRREDYCWNWLPDYYWCHVKNNHVNGGTKLLPKQYVNNCALFSTRSESQSSHLRKFPEFRVIASVGMSKSYNSMNDFKDICPLKSAVKVELPGFRKNSWKRCWAKMTSREIHVYSRNRCCRRETVALCI